VDTADMRLELEIISVMARVAGSDPRYELLPDCRIRIKEVLGGLHHEYRLEKVAA
jgi:hypothetical protein